VVEVRSELWTIVRLVQGEVAEACFYLDLVLLASNTAVRTIFHSNELLEK
jgi:hypothetical protein